KPPPTRRGFFFGHPHTPDAGGRRTRAGADGRRRVNPRMGARQTRHAPDVPPSAAIGGCRPVPAAPYQGSPAAVGGSARRTVPCSRPHPGHLRDPVHRSSRPRPGTPWDTPPTPAEGTIDAPARTALQCRKYAVLRLSGEIAGCYNFAALGNANEHELNRASPPVSPRALRLPVFQLALGLIAAAIVVAMQGGKAGLSTLTGAAVIAAAQFVFAWRTELRSRTAPAALQFGRLLLGTVLKWGVIGAG